MINTYAYSGMLLKEISFGIIYKSKNWIWKTNIGNFNN